MRRLLLSLAVFISIIGLTACGKNDAVLNNNLVFVVANTSLNFSQELAAGYRSAAEDNGVEVSVVGTPSIDAVKQAELFTQEASKSPGAMAVQNLSTELLNDPIRHAIESGIAVGTVDGPTTAASKVELHVGNDSYELGVALANETIAHLPADASGAIVVGSPSPGSTPLDMRVNGLRERFAAAMPNVQLLGAFDTQQSPAANLNSWRTLVDANPNAIAFLGVGDTDAYNLAQIRKEKGATWLAAAFDLDQRSLDAVKEGQLFALISPEHFLKGAVMGRLQANYVKNGDKLPKGWIYTPGLVVNSANIDEIVKRQASSEAKYAWFKEQIETLATDKTYLRDLPQ